MQRSKNNATCISSSFFLHIIFLFRHISKQLCQFSYLCVTHTEFTRMTEHNISQQKKHEQFSGTVTNQEIPVNSWNIPEGFPNNSFCGRCGVCIPDSSCVNLKAELSWNEKHHYGFPSVFLIRSILSNCACWTLIPQDILPLKWLRDLSFPQKVRFWIQFVCNNRFFFFLRVFACYIICPFCVDFMFLRIIDCNDCTVKCFKVYQWLE